MTSENCDDELVSSRGCKPVRRAPGARKKHVNAQTPIPGSDGMVLAAVIAVQLSRGGS